MATKQLILLLVCGSWCAGLQAQPAMGSIEKKILQTETTIAASVVNNDTAIVSALLLPGFVMTVPEGAGITKKQFLLDMKKFWHPFYQQHSSQQVRLQGNTAIITGLAEYRWKKSGQEYQQQEQYTDTYAKVNGRWLKAASHASILPPDTAAAEREVKAVVETLWKCWENGDKSTAAFIYDNNFIDTDFSGERRGKDAVLAFLQPPPAGTTVSITLADWHIIINGTTAVVNYTGEDRRTKEGKISTIKFRATDTYIKKYGHWKLIAGQQALLKG
jgi:hypothetical protein